MNDVRETKKTLDWEFVWNIEKDICFLYHELSKHDAMVCDLSYGRLFFMPYWEVFSQSLPKMDADEEEFILGGCLIMTLSMLWEILNGSGSYLIGKINQVQECTSALEPKSQNIKTLKESVLLTLNVIQGLAMRDASIDGIAIWANREFVKPYFNKRCK